MLLTGTAGAGIFSSLPHTSAGGVQKFDYFSVKVPEGWTAQQQGATVVMKSSGSDASLSIAFATRGAASFDQIANRHCEQMKGSDLTRDDSDGSYTFQYTNTAGIDCFAVLLNAADSGEDTGFYMVMAVSGYDQEEAVIDEIMDSVEFDDD